MATPSIPSSNKKGTSLAPSLYPLTPIRRHQYNRSSISRSKHLRARFICGSTVFGHLRKNQHITVWETSSLHTVIFACKSLRQMRQLCICTRTIHAKKKNKTEQSCKPHCTDLDSEIVLASFPSEGDATGEWIVVGGLNARRLGVVFFWQWLSRFRVATTSDGTLQLLYGGV